MLIFSIHQMKLLGENGASEHIKDCSILVMFINENGSLTVLSTLKMFFV